MAETLEADDGAGPAELLWHRLDDQLSWYRKRSHAAQAMYKRVKLGQIGVGALVPVLAGVGAPGLLTAAFAAAVVIAEGAQQLFRWHDNWHIYRTAAEELKQEKFLYLTQAGPYTGPDRQSILAERIASVMAQENRTWATRGLAGTTDPGRPAE